MALIQRTRLSGQLAAKRFLTAIVRDWRDYLVLTKPEISFLVAISALAGFFLGSTGPISAFVLFSTVMGTTLAAAGACALNHAIEGELDAQMKRTADRPVASGRLSAKQAYRFGVGCIVVSVCWLCPAVNAATAGLAILTVLLYVYVYTPLKRRTNWNTIVGTVPGALPALGGFVAASNDVTSPVGWAIFGVLAFWQLPHFYALAWMYRKDYDRGEFRMISVEDDSGLMTALSALAGSAGLLAVTLLPYYLGASGVIYLIGSVLLGVWLLGETVRFVLDRSNLRARRLLKASVYYIPVYVVVLIVDHFLKAS